MGERFFDDGALGFVGEHFEGNAGTVEAAARRVAGGTDRALDVGRVDRVVGAQNDETFDEVLELAHVAGKRMAGHYGEGVVLKRDVRACVRDAREVEKAPGEQGDV